MSNEESNIDRLLKARAELDEEIRRHRVPLTILFTDVVGSTAYFDRYGDTAGLAMLQRQSELAGNAVAEFGGTVIKTIGDSVMAEFPEPALAVRAAVELQRQLVRLNQTLPERERVQLRIGINHGPVFRSGKDVYGDAVNLAARISKRTGPAQILISLPVRNAIALDPELRCSWLGKITLEGKAEKEDVFEVIWTDSASYADLRQNVTAAFARGELLSPGVHLDDFLGPPRVGIRPSPTPAGAPAGDIPRPSGRGHPAKQRGAGWAGQGAQAPLAARYDILGEVGSGGMGIVYKARDRETGEVVALKLLRGEIAADEAVVERFKNELRLARKITHKNVCRIHEFNRTDGSAYISMEFVEGESLRRVLDRFGSLSPRKGIEIARQICAALREAHQQGIVHRDLKPENIMVDSAGNVKVMDFGIARTVETPMTLAGAIVGTPAYMAPEQAEGKAVDARADIYALGLILYEMFTGAPAFSGETPVAVALKQIREAPTPPRELEATLPSDIEKVILKALEKDPARRFQSIDELEAALTGQPPPRPEGSSLRTPAGAGFGAAAPGKSARVEARQSISKSRRQRVLLGLGLASAVAVVGFIATVFVTRGWKPAEKPGPEPQTQAPAEVTPQQQPTPQPSTGQQAPPSQPARQPPVPAAGPGARAAPVETGRPKPADREATRTGTTRPERAGPPTPPAGIYLQVASFGKESDAKQLVRKLQRAGFPALVVPKRSFPVWRQSYQIRVGPYPNAESAMAGRRRLEAAGYPNVRGVREP